MVKNASLTNLQQFFEDDDVFSWELSYQYSRFWFNPFISIISIKSHMKFVLRSLWEEWSGYVFHQIIDIFEFLRNVIIELHSELLFKAQEKLHGIKFIEA